MLRSAAFQWKSEIGKTYQNTFWKLGKKRTYLRWQKLSKSIKSAWNYHNHLFLLIKMIYSSNIFNLCGLAFWLMHSPLKYGPKCKGLKMRVYPVTFCSTFAKFQSKLKMFNNFVISLLYRDEQSCPWPPVLIYNLKGFFELL